MNGRGGGSEWPSVSKYQGDTDFPKNRGQLATPPISSGSNGIMNGVGFGRAPGENSPPNGPSPPASIARSSNGTSLYNGTTLYSASETGRIRREDQFETLLQEHYVALRRYLAASLRDEKGNPRPNKARDKLLRLSSVQFQELSTDVFDELLRRQAIGRKGPNGPPPDGQPPYLLPKDSFHPKRNQARQKLSTLPSSRFRDLATDVFYELERRFPSFAGGDINRTESPISMRGPPSRTGTPIEGGGMRPGSRGGPQIRRPSEGSVISGVSAVSGYLRSDSKNGGSNNGMRSPILPSNDYNRPQPKTFQSNTIIPNKSTMVEDDDDPTGGEDNDDEDAFGLENAARGDSKKIVEPKSGNEALETDKKPVEVYQLQVTELREKLGTMEEALRKKDEELNNALDNEKSGTMKMNIEKKEFSDLRLKLESQLADAQNLNESLQLELNRLRSEQSNMERELRSQIEELRTNNNDMGNVGANAQVERENEELRNELKEQRDITEEVRKEAQEFLKEMRALSERTGSSWEREEQLTNEVQRLEEEVKDWRNRYARTRTQLRGLRASSIGLALQDDAARCVREGGYTGEDGLVKDIHVTKFQISIDELLRVARAENPEKVADYMKSVVISVRRITQDIDESTNSNGDLVQQQKKLRSKVSATANNLITASKNVTAAKGLSPVSLLDAAASHLTSAVVELIRAVKIRPTPTGELEDDDDGVFLSTNVGDFPVREMKQDTQTSSYLGLRNGRVSAISSVYSSVNSARESARVPRPRSGSKDSWASHRPMSRNGNFSNNESNLGGAKLPPGSIGVGIRMQFPAIEELKIYLEDQTTLLVQTIQSLVSCIRSEAGITAITSEVSAVASVVGKVVTAIENFISSTTNSKLQVHTDLRIQAEPIIKKLSDCRKRLLEAGDKGRKIAEIKDDKEEVEWRAWTQSLPPIAFEIARETKELVQRLDLIDDRDHPDFS